MKILFNTSAVVRNIRFVVFAVGIVFASSAAAAFAKTPQVDNDELVSSKQPVELLNKKLEEGISKVDNFAFQILQTFNNDLAVRREADYLARLGLPASRPGRLKFSTWQTYANDKQLPGRRTYDPAEYKERKDVDNWVSDSEAALDFVEQASKSSKYFSPIAVGENQDAYPVWIPVALFARNLADGLLARSDLRMRQGNLEGAWDSILACFRISRLVSQEPTIAGLISATSMDEKAHKALLKLATHDQFTAAMAKKCQQDFLQLAPMPSWADKTQNEKALALQRLRYVQSGGPHALVEVMKTQPSIRTGMNLRYVRDVPTEWSEHSASELSKTGALIAARYDEIEAMLREVPRSEFVATKRKWDKENLSTLRDLGIWVEKEMNLTSTVTAADLAKLLMLYSQPKLPKLDKYETRMVHRQQYAPIVLALGAYRATNGSYPDKLVELVPDFIEGVEDRLSLNENKKASPFRYTKFRKGGYVLDSNADTKRGGISVK